MAIKNIIFDFGKVLLDWNPHYLFDSWFGNKETSDYFIGKILKKEWNDEGDIGIPMDLLVRLWSYRYPEFTGAFAAYVSEFPKTVKGEIPGMKDLILRLKEKGIKVWGLSNWSSETFSSLPKYDVINLLDGYVVSGDVHLLKPNPAIYTLLLDKYSLKASECLFVDDTKINVSGAQAVGIDGIVFKDAEHLEKHLSKILKKESPKKGFFKKK